MLVSSTEYLKRAKWGGTCLEPPPLEDKAQRLRVQSQPMLQSEFQAILDRETVSEQNNLSLPNTNKGKPPASCFKEMS